MLRNIKEGNMAHRVINFYAGPAGLPLPALERAQKELLDFEGTGMSVMEISHRAKEYDAVHHEAMSLVKELLALPDNYKVLLLQGGGNLQFCMIPMNLLYGDRKADYILTGSWAKRAHKESKTWNPEGTCIAGSTENEKFKRLPYQSELRINPKAVYVHFTSNNTVEGTQYHEFPETQGVPLVCDMSSDLMWRQFDVRPFGLIYAGAQKNMGPSGLVVVIIREDILNQCRDDLPAMLKYKTHAEKESLYNTPPCFSIYILRNVLAWYKEQGGLSVIEKWNREKAQLLYSVIDKYPDFYKGYVTEKAHRSFMNVTFHLPTPELDAKFVNEAKKEGMIGLKGYRDLGGIRVSMYNAVTVDNIKTLVSFMEEFIRVNG